MNPHRGDVTLILNGQTVTLRPTFTALAAIEHKTGHSLIALARRLANGEATLAEVQAIIGETALQPVPDLHQAPLLDIHETLLAMLIGVLTGEPAHAAE